MTNLNELNAELARSSDALATNGIHTQDQQDLMRGLLVGATLAKAGWFMTQPNWWESDAYRNLTLTTKDGVISAFNWDNQDENGDAEVLTQVPFTLTAR
jgi:hypothetical protein